MTTLEAANVLNVLKAVWEEKHGEGEAEALRMAIEALSQQDPDTISRKAAINAIEKACETCSKENYGVVICNLNKSEGRTTTMRPED